MRIANPDLQNRRRLEIISAAEQCFLKRGFHQTSMQNIAAESGLSMGLLYRYFANKEAIIEAVAQQDQEASLAAIFELPLTGDVIGAWVSLLIDMASLASSPDYAGLANEILAEANRSPKILKILQANDAALISAIANKLADQQRLDAIEISFGLEKAAHTMLLLFEGLTMRRFMTPPEWCQNNRQLMELMISSILTHSKR